MQANQEILKLQASAAEEAECSAVAVHAQQNLHDEVQTQQQVQALLHPPPIPPPLPPLCQKCGVHLKDLILCRHCHGDRRMPLLALAELLRPQHCLLMHLTFLHRPV